MVGASVAKRASVAGNAFVSHETSSERTSGAGASAEAEASGGAEETAAEVVPVPTNLAPLDDLDVSKHIGYDGSISSDCIAPIFSGFDSNSCFFISGTAAVDKEGKKSTKTAASKEVRDIIISCILKNTPLTPIFCRNFLLF